ncbi:conserved hypothetical protein [Tenacibaculum sediminilitoris]|uniref:hypothetical protein n=1 Tax=Tenacibaculum sediminilitoris TaxID=1820334 RepID=UPI0038960F53
MKRVIVDYLKLTTNILDLLVERYPDGYDHSDIISFKNSKGETVKAVEVNTEDTLFLVKISSQLQQTMEDHEPDDNDDDFDEIEITDDFDND